MEYKSTFILICCHFSLLISALNTAFRIKINYDEMLCVQISAMQNATECYQSTQSHGQQTSFNQ